MDRSRSCSQSNEEDGFAGIEVLAPGALKGRTYINVDNEAEGELLNSSAGGVHVEARRTYREVATPPGSTGREITIDGLLGGHSGIDINKERGSAHQLMARLLVKIPAELEVRLAELVGGEMANAIPRRATAIVAVPTGKAEAFGGYLADFGTTVARELATTDPGVNVTVSPVDLPAKVMERAASRGFSARFTPPRKVSTARWMRRPTGTHSLRPSTRSPLARASVVSSDAASTCSPSPPDNGYWTPAVTLATMPKP